MAGNGVQDVHIALSNLPKTKAIRSVLVLGDGGGGWVYNIGPYYASSSGVLVQTAGASTADLYVEPYQVETGRRFDLTVTYDDQSTASFSIMGGPADPGVRMPAFVVAARWAGQGGVDLTGPSPGVGPDGIQDAHLALTHLFSGTSVTAVSVTDSSGRGWASGTNPGLLNNAEFVRNTNDPSQGDLYFNPSTDPNGQTFTVAVTYADGKVDRSTFTAGHFNPQLAQPAPAPPTVNWNAFRARWLGQDGLDLLGAGDVHIALDGLPAGRSVVVATLSDQVGLDWTYVKPGSGATPPDPSAGALGFRAQSDPTRVDLTFQPGRDESGATLTLTLLLDDGTTLAVRFAGGFCDPGLRAPDVAPGVVVAHPGDDLNDLANRYGTVRLVAGLYPMNQPLVLNRAVTITADPGATLLFSQGPSAPAWTAAIKVRASHITLNGFAVRFAGPVRWADGISYGPAVIGSPDNTDPWTGDPMLDLTFTRLDLQSPPASTDWEEAPRMFRLATAGSGTIANNLLKGGVTELQNGPWTVTGNTYTGTVPNTFAYGAFATHSTHDVVISGNTVAPRGPSGKTWRFLVMTQSGVNDVISGNTVSGIGPMDSDTVVNPNAPELILTEAYRLHYEGLTTSVSADGYVVQIPPPQGTPARTGDVLAILSGPQAGQWRVIAQVLSPTTYLLDAPITPGKFAVSLATGFINQKFLGNTVDARGSSTSFGMVLVGNQFGVKVIGNHFIGGDYAFKITAGPSELPVTWGWTHAPALGATIESNTVEDTVHGGVLDVEQGGDIKSTGGRVYFSGTFTNNTGVWSTAFLAARTKAGVTASPVLVTVGNDLSGDPGTLVLSATGNRVSGPSSVVSGSTFMIMAATVNGVAQRNTGIVLTSASAGGAVDAGPQGGTPNPPVSVPTTPVPQTPSVPETTPVVPVAQPPVVTTVGPIAPVASFPAATTAIAPAIPVAPGTTETAHVQPRPAVVRGGATVLHPFLLFARGRIGNVPTVPRVESRWPVRSLIRRMHPAVRVAGIRGLAGRGPGSQRSLRIF